MPRDDARAERREGIFDRQYEVYKESHEQRGLSVEQAEAKADEELETGGERGSEPDRG